MPWEPGHGVADCPAVLESQDMGTGICYRCGSTEHDISKCKAKIDPAIGPFPYAKCFICGEMGHLSRSCPDNPKGLYAEGGGCKLCGSVEHFRKDCPVKQNGDQVTVGRWATGMSADYEEITEAPKLQKTKVKVPKVVTFWKPFGCKPLCIASLQSKDYTQWVSDSSTLLLQNYVGFFCPPLIFPFASQTHPANCKVVNHRNTASGYFAFIYLCQNTAFPLICSPHCQLSEEGNWLLLGTGIWLQ